MEATYDKDKRAYAAPATAESESFGHEATRLVMLRGGEIVDTLRDAWRNGRGVMLMPADCLALYLYLESYIEELRRYHERDEEPDFLAGVPEQPGAACDPTSGICEACQ